MARDASHPARRPPRLALWLLERRVPEHEREFLVGDLVESFQEAGESPEAQREARRRFWREAIAASLRREHDLHAIPFTRGLMSDIGFDLSLAARRLRRSPGFTLTASLTLALGVGAACAITAVARPALWGTLPFRDSDRIVTLRERFGDGSTGRLGYKTIADIGRETTTLAQLAAVRYWSPTLTDASGAARLNGLAVSANWLAVMGVRPVLGRGFTPEEDRPNAAGVVLLHYGLWQQRFGGDSGIVGRTIKLGDVDHRVIGVLPADYESVLRPEAEILQPLGYTDTTGSACRDCRHLQAVARVRDGVPIATAARDAESVFARLRDAYPATYGSHGLAVTPLRDELVENTRGPLLALLGASALLLLIALANTSNLFLARGIRRSGELTLRAALGASRWRLARSMLMESLLVSGLGALFGTALAHSALGGLVALAPASLPRIEQVRIDLPITLFTVALALTLGLLSGLLPAVFLHARGLRQRLATTSRTVVRGSHDAVRRALVVAELSLALLLLCGAGLLVQSVQRLLAVDLGFETDHRIELALSATGARFETDEMVRRAWRSVHEAVRVMPGVTSASLTSQLPLSDDFDSWGVRWERPAAGPEAQGEDAFRFAVTADYAATMGLTLVSGRFLSASDLATTEKVVVINQQLARHQFGDQSPLGARLRIGPVDAPLRTVVGVVGDVRHPALDASVPGQLYLPMEQNPFADSFVRLVVHSTTDPGALTRALREAVLSVNGGIPIAEVSSMSALVDRAASQRRFAERLFQAFALAALVLAAVGIFGVLSGMVGERVREIGVRSALGATREQILAHFLRQGGALAALGITIGAVGAAWLGSALRPLVYGISPRDPVTIVTVSLGLGAVALVATLLPAWRASRVDAMVALRAE
ncbi:MAG: ABC transporter permease [Gemmatimonadetes bacterium]|nr:ABC transporter permease [Gemmatimonadota bacterium]